MRDNNKMYFFKVPKKTESGLDDFLEFSETYLESFPEVPNNAETIGKFTLKFMGKSLDFIPALVVEDSDGNMTEYYVFDNPETIKHELVMMGKEEQTALRQVSEIKNALSANLDKSFSEEDEETTEKFYSSKFRFQYIDNVNEKTHEINLTMCAQYYEFFQSMLSELAECIKTEF